MWSRPPRRGATCRARICGRRKERPGPQAAPPGSMHHCGARICSPGRLATAQAAGVRPAEDLNSVAQISMLQCSKCMRTGALAVRVSVSARSMALPVRLGASSARGPTRHETASALNLLTLRRLPGSIRKSSGKEAQTLALPPDHLGAHVCHSNLALYLHISCNAYTTL
jgi:hypothetical protein